MAFDSEEGAYNMYNSYAGKIGFSIRKSWTRRRKDNSIYQKHIVARISRKATSGALKGKDSKEVLDYLEKAIDKLLLDVDDSVSQKQDNVSGTTNPHSCTKGDDDILKGKITIRVPPILKGPKSKRSKNVLEKKRKNSSKSAKKKGK